MADAFAGLRLAGLLLTGGLVLLLVLVGPTAFVSPAIWNGPPEVALRLVDEHALVWRIANIGFALATVVTAAGLVLVPGVVGDRGESVAWVSAVAYILAAVPWLVTLAIRVVITPGVAQGFVGDGVIDPAFEPLARLAYALFPVFILAAWASIVALGAAVVLGGSLGDPVGWVCVVGGLAIGAGYVVIGDTLPAFVYLPTGVVGIAMLLSSR